MANVVTFTLNDSGITFFANGIVIFDCPIERIQKEPRQAIIAMKMIVECYEEELSD